MNLNKDSKTRTKRGGKRARVTESNGGQEVVERHDCSCTEKT